MEGADCVAILTEWNQFRALSFERMKKLVKRPVLVDLRNIYKPAEMAAAGIEYHSIGRPHVPVATRD
jgi:UDPglucose 6-dehydrogenase